VALIPELYLSTRICPTVAQASNGFGAKLPRPRQTISARGEIVKPPALDAALSYVVPTVPTAIPDHRNGWICGPILHLARLLCLDIGAAQQIEINRQVYRLDAETGVILSRYLRLHL
jgi:hypothetical protein